MLSQLRTRERRDVDVISDVVQLLAAWREEPGGPVEDMVFSSENGSGFLSPTVVLRSPLPSDGCRGDSTGGADARETDIPQLQAHISRSRRSRAVRRSPGSPAISDTPHSRSRPTSTATGNEPSGNSKRPRWRAPSQSEDRRAESVLPPESKGQSRMNRKRQFAGISLMGRVGIEPTTLGLKVPCSTD